MATDPESREISEWLKREDRFWSRRQDGQKDRLNVIWVIVALVVFVLLQMLGIPNMAFT